MLKNESELFLQEQHLPSVHSVEILLGINKIQGFDYNEEKTYCESNNAPNAIEP